MNFIKGLYCRIFQTALKLAIPMLPYRFPRVVHSVEDVPALLAERKITRVLVVTDGFHAVDHPGGAVGEHGDGQLQRSLKDTAVKALDEIHNNLQKFPSQQQ